MRIDTANVQITWGGVALRGFASGEFLEVDPGPPLFGAPTPAPQRDEESDLQHAAAGARVRAIRAAMERCAPGSTYDGQRDPGLDAFHYRLGPGDRWARYVAVSASAGFRHPIRYDTCEGAWLPEAGPISDLAGGLPEGEAPEETARRLLGRAPEAAA